MNILKEQLAFQMQNPPPPNPLEKEIILVQSPGMAQWLKQAIAENNGIAAALEFSLPASFIWKLFAQVLDDIPEKSSFNKETMSWRLMKLIPSLLHLPEFTPLKAYLQDDTHQIRRFQLANHVADIFDQYLIYRPEWILAWEQGDTVPRITVSQLWQPLLWQALVEQINIQNTSSRHQANLFESFAKRLRQGPPFNVPLPKRVFIIGISALPVSYLNALTALGEQIEVHLFHINPCRYYWGDISDACDLAKLNQKLFKHKQTKLEKLYVSNHSLLASFGKLGRDYNAALLKLNTEYLNVNDQCVVEIQEDSLLHCIQRDIFELEERNAPDSPSSSKKTAIQANDISLTVHQCYTSLREVEVLHDQLLMRLDNDSTLSPKDIIVMTPNVEEYVSAFHRVFGTLKGTDRYIPYGISDQKITNEYPMLICLQQLLTLNLKRCTATELLNILETPAVMRCFNIKEASFKLIRYWVEKAGIRWGLDENYQKQFDIPASHENTWLFGLERMLLGYAMPQSDGLFNNSSPLDQIQGNDAILAGILAEFLARIQTLISALTTDRTPKEWCRFIRYVLTQFFKEDSENDQQAELLIQNTMHNFNEQLIQTGNENEALSLLVVQDYLQTYLEQNRRSPRFLSGRMNVCTLMSMRSIPFRVICLLGMSHGTYPRSIPVMGFDLIASHPKQGDCSHRDDDRYLFLEALLSATDNLYISYIARNIQDDSARPSSVLISELLHYCGQGFYCSEDEKLSTEEKRKNLLNSIITAHPLMPFSPSYFTQTNAKKEHKPYRKLFSYANQWLSAAASSPTNTPEAFAKQINRPETIEQLPFEVLTRFFKNPVKYFFQQKLKIYFDEVNDKLEDTEPFEIDTLQQYTLKQALLSCNLNDKSSQQFYQEQRAEGHLPHGPFGELLINKLQQKIEKNLIVPLQPIISHPKDDIDFVITLKDTTLTGRLRNHYQQGLLHYRPAKPKGTDFVSAWLHHLCYCIATAKPIATLIIQEPEKENQCLQMYRLTPISTNTAQQMLEQWLSVFFNGQNYPLPFFPKTAWKWLECQHKEKSPCSAEQAKEKAKQAFSSERGTGEADFCRYIRRAWPELDDNIFPNMCAIAEQLLLPVIKNMQTEKVEG